MAGKAEIIDFHLFRIAQLDREKRKLMAEIDRYSETVNSYLFGDQDGKAAE